MNKTDKKCIVYKVSSPSGKVYIGITAENLSDRISKHKYVAMTRNSQTIFAKAIRKYGVEHLKWEIVEEDLTQDEAMDYEKFYIELYDSYKKGYNSTLGGEGAFGVKWSEEAKNKHTKMLKEKYWDCPEWKQKKSNQTKEYYKNNPERKKELIERGTKALKTVDQTKRIKALTSRETKIKSSLTRGCKEFNVYDFVKKKYIGTWLLKSECNRELKLSNGKISSCLNGDRNHHKTYIFKYVDDPTVKGMEFNPIWLKSIKRKVNENI